MQEGGQPEADVADRIAEAWARERPELPVRSIGVITRIWHLAKLLDDDRRATMQRLGMDVTTRRLLSELRRAGPPFALTPSEIARHAGVSAAAVSQWVARGESDGYVTRRRDGADGRSVMITLTARGRRRIDAVVAKLLEREDDLVVSLDDDQLDDLSSLLRTLLADLTSRRR